MEYMQKAAIAKPSAPEVRFYLSYMQMLQGKDQEALCGLQKSWQDGLCFSPLGLRGAYYLATLYEKHQNQRLSKKYFLLAARHAHLIQGLPKTKQVQKIVNVLESKGYFLPLRKK